MSKNSKKLIYGKGSKGNGISWVNGRHSKAYAVWESMLCRCYSPKLLSRYPTYIGCFVCDAWLFFPTFQEWFDNNYIEGFELDKDLLVAGNREYGPETCSFVPQCINKLFTDRERSRGKYPLGVYLYKPTGKYKTQLNIDGKLKHLGYFDNVNDAHQAYLIAKKANVIRVANEWKGKISDNLYEALLAKADGII